MESLPSSVRGTQLEPEGWSNISEFESLTLRHLKRRNMEYIIVTPLVIIIGLVYYWAIKQNINERKGIKSVDFITWIKG